jgi:fatty-acid desaturase
MLEKLPASEIARAAAAVAGRPTWRVKWNYAAPVAAVHLIALLAFVPWFFSWIGVVLVLLGLYVFGTLGINVCYHRLLTHRGFACPRWLEHTLAILGVCCMQESPIVWVAYHRQHHQYPDEELDPHSPLASFLWGHMGWLVVRTDDSQPGPLTKRYARDLQRDSFYAWLEARDNWAKIVLVSWAAYFIAGFVAVAATGGSLADAIQFGSSLVVWGAAMRTVLVWHITWSVNSVTHLWGYRNFETPDNSRNNVFVGLISNGEGWHNNHHYDPHSARHGLDWREPDMAWLTIRLMSALGLARNIALPRRAARQP